MRYGKGDKARNVPVNDYAWLAVSGRIEECEEGDFPLVMLSDRAARDAYTRIAKFCGMPGYATHSGRATVATEVLESTGNVRLAQEILGHASSSTTERYTLVTESAMREALRF